MEPQILPSLPTPLAEDEAERCQIFLFGDLTITFEDELRDLIHLKSNETLRAFFDQVGFALRDEIGRLPTSQQDHFPRFTQLVDLVLSPGETQASPVLRFCLLSVCEIGQLIRYVALSGSIEHCVDTIPQISW